MAHDRPRVFPDDASLSSSILDTTSLPLARTVLDRFRYGVRKPVSQGLISESSKDASIIASDFGPASSQSAIYESNHKLRALDINQARSHVILAGVKILKTVRIDDEPSCTEEFDLRAAAVNHSWGSSSGRRSPAGGTSRAVASDAASAQRDTFDIEDVAWSNNEFRDYIATAARNGKIMLYDMTRPGVEVGSLHEHFRQVHKVDFNPMEGACLLSGSQDGTVRLWDLRNYRKNAMVCTSMHTFPGRSEGVRHVKWSPRDTWSFAFGTDNGVIQRWDTRHNRSPVLKFSAHHSLCNSIDWHPDGKHLVSAGKDQNVKVWNVSPDARGGAVFSVRTPREVQNVRWRPSCFINNSQDQGIKQCTHFATSYKDLSVVHVWDLRRPFIPFREIHHRVNRGTTDMLWRTKDLLWTVGPEGEFSQTDVPFAPKSVDRRPLSVVSCAPHGEANFSARKRPSRMWGSSDVDQRVEEGAGRDRRGSRTTDRFPFSRSPGDDSLEEQFLSASSVKKRHSRAASIRSNKSFGTTPPSTDEMARLITTDLKLTMDAYGSFRAGQPSKIGSLPGASESGIFTYLAQSYEQPIRFSDYDLRYLQELDSVFARNAYAAQRASLYRDSQTWKIFGFQMLQQLRKRAEANREARVSRSVAEKEEAENLVENRMTKVNSPNANSIEQDHVVETSEPVKHISSLSDAPTPVARPVEQLSDETHSDADVDGMIDLPPSMTSDLPHHPSLQPAAKELNMAGADRIEKPTFSKRREDFDLNEREAAMSRWQPKPRVPYSLDPTSPEQQGINIPSPLDRRDSSDSFMIFSTSSDSQSHHVPASSFLSSVSQSTGRENGNDRDRPRFQSSFHSTDSTDSKLSPGLGSQDSHQRDLGESHESFVDLPTNGNLLVDDFVEHDRNRRYWRGEGSAITSRSSTGEFSVAEYAENHDPNGKEQTSRPQTASNEQHKQILSSKASGLSKTNKPGEHNVQAGAKFEALAKMIHSAPAVLSGDHKRSLSSEALTLADYLVPNEAAADGPPTAVESHDMLKQVLEWYSSRGNAQMASHVFLQTAPLLAPPGTSSSTTNSFNALLNSSYFEHLTSAPLAFPVEAAESILENFHAPLHALDISPAFAESVLSTYHDQLMTSNLLNPAADLRRLAYPAFPAVFEQGLKDVDIGTMCLGCNNPINNPINKMRCESCNERQAECAICLCRDSPFEIPSGKKNSNSNEDHPRLTFSTPQPAQQSASSTLQSSLSDSTASRSLPPTSAKLHTTCLLCNHTTHTACSIAWFADTASQATGSGGACPVPGCLCDCVPGYYRSERLKKQEIRDSRRRSAGALGAGVKKDDWNVGQSRAVGRVRGALKAKDPVDGSTSPGSEPGRSSRRVRGAGPFLGQHGRAMSDEAKRVRLVSPESE